jgi:murein DD-endopeptidase MepM/ murein hydrolase activator NlpD
MLEIGKSKELWCNGYMHRSITTSLMIAVVLFVVGIATVNQDSPRWQHLTMPFRIARLSTQTPNATILMPVQGIRVSQVADTWGAPRSGGRKHEGQDIFASRGTPIYAAADGIITRMTDRTLGGTSLFITVRGGHRHYYTHLDAYAEGIYVGQPVSTDTLIGYVGNTGNARTTPPHLHFGIYTASGAIDPLPLLRNR